MSKHTPGPWVVDTTLSSGEVMTANGYAIHEHPSYSSITDAKEIQANARLIAAAPRMSDTLRRAAHILAELPDQSPQLIALRSQIVQCINQATPEYYSVTQAE